jgi:hypothetical protein
MDGGSTDGSGEIIKRYENCLAYWESHRDEGQTDTVYRGFERSPEDLLKVAGDLNYIVCWIPYMVPVTNPSEMSAHMLFFEDFLLVPKDSTHGR